MPERGKNSTPWTGPHGRRHRRIHQELRHLGETRRWWADACRLIQDETLETGAHIVFHALRELNSMLLDLLAPIADPASASVNAEKVALVEKLLGEAGFDDKVIDGAKRALPSGAGTKIGSICKLLDLDPSVAKRWKNWKPVAKAHRRGLGMRSITDPDVQASFAEAEVVIGAVAERWAHHYPRWFALVAEIAASDASKASVQRLLDSVPALHELMTCFFTSITEVEWFPHVRDQGLLTRVPDAELSDDGSAARVLPWPAAAYLRSVAEKMPEEVRAALAEVAGSDNPLALHDVMGIAALLPAEAAASLVASISDGVARWRGVRPPRETVGGLLRALMVGGASDDAVRLARAVLALDGAHHVGGQGEHGYKRLLGEILVAFGPEQQLAVAEVLLNVLAEASVGAADRSVVWLRAVDDNRRRDDARPAVARALYDIVHHRPEMLQELMRSGVPAAQRIALHVARVDKGVDPAVVLRDTSVLAGDELRIELGELVRDRWSDLDRDVRIGFLHFVADGPPAERITQAQNADQFIRRWKGFYLKPIMSHLDQKDGAVTNLLAEADVPNGEVLQRYETRVSLVVPESPWDTDELVALELAELIDRIRTFEPTDDRRGPTRRGLGDAVAGVVAADVDRYRDLPRAMADLSPELLYGAVAGVADAARRNPIDWRIVIDAASAATSWNGDPGGAWDDLDQPRLQVRLRSLGAIQARLRHDDMLPEDMIRAVLDSISVCLDDPHPSGDEPWLDLGPGGEPPGTVRNTAFDALVQLAASVARTTDLGNSDVGGVLLDALNNEKNPHVFAQVAYRAHVLADVAPDWVRAYAHLIFGEPGSHDPRHQMAWRTISFRDPPEGALGEVLKTHYETWIGRLAGAPLTEHDLRIAHHMGALAVAGLIDADAVDRFFALAPVEARAAALSYAVPQTADQIDASRALWEARAAAVTDDGVDPAELSAVATWARSDLLDPAWRLTQLDLATSVGAPLARPDIMLTELGMLVGAAIGDAEKLLDVLDRVLAQADIHDLAWSTDNVAGILAHVEKERPDLDERASRSRGAAALRLQDLDLLRAQKD